MGGLGNQMLQYAAGFALAERLKTDLLLDLSFYETQHLHAGLTPRQYELHWLGIQAQVCDETTRKRFEKPPFYQKIGRMLGILPHFTRWNEPHFHYHPRWETLKGNVYLNGYWSSEKYFKEYRKTLKHIFLQQTSHLDSQNEGIVQSMKNTESVSIHVRRGDYLTNASAAAFHGVCSPRYYQDALAYLKKKLGDQVKLYVFSDDPDWVKDHLFQGESFTLLRHNSGSDSYKDLLLMACCKHHIIANSSFSWWGAWLGDEDGMQIAPSQWFLDQTIQTQDLYPTSWIRL